MRILSKPVCISLGAFGLLCYAPVHAQMSIADARPTHVSEGIYSSISKADRKLYIRLAEANLAEIDAAKLALKKSEDAQIKDFAQRMIQDHSEALGQVSDLARNKQIELPPVPNKKHRKAAERMQALAPIEFNAQYAKTAVEDHREVLDLLDKIIAKADDSDLKALAQTLKPKIQEHLKMAMALTAGTQ